MAEEKFKAFRHIKYSINFYRHSGGAYFAGNVPSYATKFLAAALVDVVEAHAQSILPEI